MGSNPMLSKIFVFLAFFSVFASVAWGNCSIINDRWTSGNDGDGCGNANSLCPSRVASYEKSCYYGMIPSGNPYWTGNSSCSSPGWYQRISCEVAQLCCDNQCEADSASSGGIILECQFDVGENKWYRYECHGGTNCSAGGCQRIYYNDETLCRDKYCQDNPTLPECQPPCDSAKWTCETTTERTQTTIASDNVTCFGGDCFGGVYCEYVTKNTTTCTNECGGTTTQENSIPIRYEGACNPDNLTDDDECTGVRCISFAATKSYSLYKLCKSREIVNGEQKFLPRMVGGGVGNCASNGYLESNDSTGFAGSSDSLKVPESCFTMGLGCPPPDTTNYSSNDDRTAANGCACVPYDGLSSVSKIICPDGSISVFLGSCDNWKQSPLSSSSSVEPPESSSGSENPASSGGGDMVGDWANYSQGEQIIGLLAAIASNTMEKSDIKSINTINVALDDYTTGNSDVDVPFNRTDSIYNPSYVVDTAGLKQVIFGRVTEQNQILDTLLSPASKCPCFTFFSGGGSQAQISGAHISFPKMEFDFSSFHGFDLCHIISVIVTSLASVVAFFIGFAIFKNVSQ